MAGEDRGPRASIGWERWALASLLALYLAWGLLYLAHQPWGGGLDEPQHRAYIGVLGDEHRLPWLYRLNGRWVRYRDAHAMHPPAYYVAMLPLYWAVRALPEEAIRVALRLASLALGAGTLLLVHRIARAALGDDRHAALAATLIVALMPLYLLVSAIVNNDIASVLTYALLLYLGLVRWRDALSWKRVALLGVVAGLAGLTKGTSEVAALGSGLYIVYSASRALGRAQAVARAAVFAGVMLALVLPWHLRNLRLYGALSYMPDDGKPTWLPTDEGLLVCLLHDNLPFVLRHVLTWQLNTLWSQKDWIPEAWRAPVYDALALAALVGLAVVLLGLARRRGDGEADRPCLPRRPWAAMLWGALPLWGMAVYIACMKHMGWAEGGRYLLPLLPALACLIAAPIRLVPESRAAARWALVGLVALAWVALNVLCYGHLVGVLIPLYRPGG